MEGGAAAPDVGAVGGGQLRAAGGAVEAAVRVGRRQHHRRARADGSLEVGAHAGVVDRVDEGAEARVAVSSR